MINEIREFLESEITTIGVYAFQRPSGVDSITIKPSSSPQANVEMWSQEQFFNIEVLIKESQKASYDLCLSIRDILVGARGILVNNGQKILKIYAENTAPEVVDVTQEDNEVYGITYRVKYIDNSIPI
jgi:hypothetical protein